MAITLVGSATASTVSTANRTWTATYPSGVQDGDILIAWFTTNTTAALSSTTGWTTIGSLVSYSTDHSSAAVYRIASSEGASWTFTNFWAATEIGHVVVTAWREVDQANPINRQSITATASTATSVSGPSLTPTVNNCKFIQMLGADPGTGTYAATPDASPVATEIFDAKDTSGSSYTYAAIQHYTQATAAALALDYTGLTSDGYTYGQVVLAPAPTPTISDAGDEGFYDGQTSVTITGTGFYTTQGSGKVELGNSSTYASATKVAQTITSWSSTSITITVAQGALSNGTLYLFATNKSNLTSTAYTVTLDTRPTITDAGDEAFFNGETGVVVTGTNFKSTQGTGTISLNTAADGSGTNVAQTVTSWSDTSITITIAQGAISNGTAYLIVNNSNKVETTGYAVTLGTRPTITDAGDEGFYTGQTNVVITGTNFGTSQGSGSVSINSNSGGTGTNVVQTVTSWANTSITITVDQGALTGGTNYLIVNNSSLIHTAGYAVIVNTRPTITDAGDESFYSGETGIVITGTDFGASQGSGSVTLNSAQNGSGTSVAQTVTAWSNTSITITVAQGALTSGTNYLIVNNSSLIDTNGYAVTVYPRPTITNAEDEIVSPGETGVVIDGTNFQTPQGTGGIQLNSAADGSGTGVTQSVTAWSNTQATITIAKGSLSYGTNYLILTTRHGNTSAGYAITLIEPPIITDAGNEAYYPSQTGIVITGTTFGTTKGSGSVSLNSAADGSGTNVVQTTTSWSDTSITFTASLGGLSYGANYLIVANDSGGTSTGYLVYLGPQPTITDAGDETFLNNDTNISITGTGFGATQNLGYVALNTAANGSGFSKVQTITSWSDTHITFSIDLGAMTPGSLYLIVASNYGIPSVGYAVTVQLSTSGVAKDWFIDYVPNSPLTLSHIDGTLAYDTGAGTIPAVDGYLRGGTTGAITKILAETGTAASGTLTLTNTTARFQNNETLTWLNQVNIDGVVNGGIQLGDVVTGASSGRTGTVRAIEYRGTAGTLYSEGFTGGSWTDNENIRVSGQTRAQANGTGSLNSAQWTGALANGSLTPATVSGILNYVGGSVLIPPDASITGSVSGATGIVHLQYGSTSTGSLFVNDVTGTWQNNDTLNILQVVNYDNQVSGQKFRVGNIVTGSTSGANGRVLKVINDGDSTGRLMLADQVGIFDHTTPDDLEVGGVKIAEVENATFVTSVANVNGSLITTQTPAQGGLYDNSINPVRSVNSLYTYLMDTFDEIDQLDDLVPLSSQVKNQQYTLVNEWIIPDLSMRFLDQGSIQDENQDNVWTNITTIGDVQGITDQRFAATNPQPQLYVSQANAVIPTFWLEGHINALIKVKTNTAATQNDDEGTLIGEGIVTVYARNYTHTYSHEKTNQVGGVAAVPLSTSTDVNNTTGTYSLNYTGETAGPFLVGEQINLADYSKSGIIITLTDNGTTGTITYTPTSSTNFASSDTIIGKKSGASATVSAAPTALIAGYTDISLTFTGTEHDLNNGNGLRPYDCTIDCHNRPLTQVYEYLKYLTGKENTVTLNGNSGNQYQAVGDIRLPYDSQTGNFTEGLTITGNLSDATGIITADHDDGASGALILRNITGTFVNGELITDTSTGSATISGSAESIARIEASPFGTLAGGKFFGARGVWLANVLAADANNYELIDSEGVRQVPPITIAVTVNGVASGDRVSVFRTTGDNETIDRAVYISHASANTSGLGTFTTTLPIAKDTPLVGVLRVVNNNINDEDQYAYDSWSGNTFTLSSGVTLNHTYDSSDTAYVAYIDRLATSTSESEAVAYDVDRYVLTVLRVAGQIPFKVKGQITNQGLTATAIRTTDIIYTP